jgi:hypothetical protein
MMNNIHNYKTKISTNKNPRNYHHHHGIYLIPSSHCLTATSLNGVGDKTRNKGGGKCSKGGKEVVGAGGRGKVDQKLGKPGVHMHYPFF